MENNEGELYKAMYYKLFNAVTDALEVPTDTRCCRILCEAQQATEEMLMSYQNTESRE